MTALALDGYRWTPGTYTAPLSPTFVSDGPRLRRFVELFCRDDDGNPLVLDPWQAALIDAILERYPDDWHDPALAGRLRYRECVVSVARQNGKSEIAHVLGFYGMLMHEPSPYMVGLASNKEQADLIYRRVYKTIIGHPALSKRFKATGTRGVRRLDKDGYYVTKPAKADALQGIPVTLCLFDEVHLCDEDMWTAMVLGTQAKRDGLVIGLTTAGDDNSTLLRSLYERGRDAATGDDERFGFFLWEAPEGARVDDPEALMDANPSVACGRRDMAVLLDAVRGMPEDQARRYVLNQFVSSQSSWLPSHLWHAAAAGPVPVQSGVVFTVDRTPSWEFATVTATVKTDEGVHTGVVAALRKPNAEWLLDLCMRLYQHNPSMYVMDGYTLGDLAAELKRRGYPVKVMRQGDVSNACSTAYALIAQGKVRHANDGLVNQQMPFAIRKNIGDAWRISRQASSVSIDAVMATVLGIAVAYNQQEAIIPIY